MRRAVLALGLTALTGAALASDEMQPSVKASRDHVGALAPECTYTDGYACETLAEDDFLSPAAAERMVPGVYLGAWQAALADFRAIDDLDEASKALHHYRIGFTEDEQHFIVLFRALLMPRIEDGEAQGTMMATFGRTTKYWIDKRTGSVAKRLYYR